MSAENQDSSAVEKAMDIMIEEAITEERKIFKENGIEPSGAFLLRPVARNVLKRYSKETLEKLREKIEGKFNPDHFHDNQWERGWTEALDWVLKEIKILEIE